MAEEPSPLPFANEHNCAIISRKTEKQCNNKAKYYHRADNGTLALLCRVHAKTYGAPCQSLPIDELRTEKQKEMYNAHVERAFQAALKTSAPGRLQCLKISAMRVAPFQEHYLNVMLVLDAVRRRDGIDGSALAPGRLGPVVHEQPGLPPATSVSAYVVGSEVWTCEMDLASRMPIPHWFEMRIEIFGSVVVRRPKYRYFETTNRLEYSLYVTLAGQERRFDAIEARYFFCTAYADLAVRKRLFAQLKEWHADGVDLCFCGFDAPSTPVPWPLTADALYRDYYCNDKVAFGHELVLLALLLCEDTHDELPWDRYRREYPSNYSGVAHVGVKTYV